MISGGLHNLSVVFSRGSLGRQLIDLSAVARESLVTTSEVMVYLSYARRLLVIIKRVMHVLQGV